MWVSASLENARRRLTAARQMAARVQTRHLAQVFGRVAAILLCLELLYLAVGNVLLKTQAIQHAIASSDGFHLDFDDAYTLWPGHVRVRNLSLRIEDYNVQFEVALGRADVDIALSELPFKKFHVTRLVAEGTRFRLRHKLIVIGDDGERVAAYPPIRDFADPPYYVGVRPAQIPDKDDDLWSVRVENVQARVSELWVMEYRFRGDGVAHGSFVVKPARWVQVEPATLELSRGTLTLGEHLVAAQMSGRMTCDIPDMHVQETDGIQVFKDISATIRFDLAHGQLDFLQAYLARLGSARYAGNGDWRLDLNIVHGVVQRGSHVSMRASPLEIRHELASVSGDVMANFGRDFALAPDQLVLAVSAPTIVARRARSDAAALRVEGLAGALRIRGTDLTSDFALGLAEVVVQKARAPSLAWFATSGTTLRGSADATLSLERHEDGELSGQARLEANDAEVSHGALSVVGDLHSQLVVSRGSEAGAPFVMRKLVLELTRTTLTSGEKHSQPLALVVDGSGLRITPEGNASASGAVRVHVSSAEALLPLVLSDPFKGVASSALDLKGVEARAAIDVSKARTDVELFDATSGNLHMRGYLAKRVKNLRGAFLLSSGPIHVGVTLSDGSTKISPFVADSWLATAWPRISSAAPGPS